MKELKRFVGYLKGYGGQIVLAVTLVLAVTVLTLPYPLILRRMLDEALPQKNVRELLVLMALFLAFFLARGVLSYLNRYVLQRMGMRITCDLRKDIFRHLQTLSVKFYESRQTGRIVARVIQDTDAVFVLITNVVVSFLSDALTLLAVSVMLFCISWKLALLTMAVLPFFLLNYRLSQNKLRRLSTVHRHDWDRVVGFLHERVAGSRLVKSFSMEEREIEQFTRGIEKDYRNANRTSLYNTRLWVIADMISSFGGLLVLTTGGWLIIRDQLSIGSLVAFNTYIGFLFSPIVRLNDLNAVVQRAVTSLEKIYEVLDTPSFAVEQAGAVDLQPVRGRIEFRNVQFSYDAGRKTLNDINLTVEQDQMVAFVGPSGSGKTTLVNLLCRFYDVDAGAILVDDHDVRRVKIASLRRQLGIVSQETLMFSGSLLDNIRYGRPEATFEAILEAARAANAHDFIEQLPRGYHTLLGERGVKLSGGQRQRIAIARAILKNPRILILDEATSSLDTESEQLIQEALERLMKNRTTIVIAHRLSTVLRADKIVVLQRGEIVEQGRHEELLRRGGLYQRLYDIQFQSRVASASRPLQSTHAVVGDPFSKQSAQSL